MRRNAEMTLLADDDLDRPGADMRPAFTASSLGDPTLGDCHRRLVPRCPPPRCCQCRATPERTTTGPDPLPDAAVKRLAKILFALNFGEEVNATNGRY